MRYSWSTPDFSLHTNAQSSPVAAPHQPTHLIDFSRIRTVHTADMPLIPSSSPLCPHKHHCVQNAIMKGFFRTFSAAFIFKTSLSFLPKLLAGKLSLRRIQRIYLDQDSVLFALFVGLMSFTYKAVLCSLRHFRNKRSMTHKAIAGFLAAAWIGIDDPVRRRQIALYCLVRALHDLLKATAPHIATHSAFALCVFTVSQLPIMHGLVHAPRLLDARYYAWIKHMGHLTETQCQTSFRSRLNASLPFRLPSERWTPCSPLFHADASCARHHAGDWAYGLLRACRMYVPVHCLPALLFAPKKVLRAPAQWAQAGRGILR